MPWQQDFSRFTHRVYFMMIMEFIVLTTLGLLFFRVTPAQVYNKLQGVESELRITTETSRTAIEVTQKEVADLKKKMLIRDRQLKVAEESLKRLDPQYTSPTEAEIERSLHY